MYIASALTDEIETLRLRERKRDAKVLVILF